MNNNSTNERPYKYLPFLSMLYVSIMLAIAVLTNKIIVIDGHITLAGTLFMPFWFILADIISEVYGYKIAQQTIWLAFSCHFIFSVICQIALIMPSPNFWHGQVGYNLVLGNLLRIVFSAFIIYIISATTNIYLITKWKILMKGKYFWLRSIGASTIGELLYTIMAVIIMQYHTLNFSQMKSVIITSWSIKVIFSLFSSLPGNFVVYLLKHIENLPNLNDKINPFKNYEKNIYPTK